jgi:hypothetical protein
MGDHPFWFIDDNNVRVFKDDLQRDIFRLNGRRGGRRDRAADPVVRLQLVARFFGLAVNGNVPVGDQFFGVGAGQVQLGDGRQEMIEPGPFLRGVDDQRERFRRCGGGNNTTPKGRSRRAE